MATMNISLTEDLKAFVEQQVTERSYTSTSEYMRTVLRRERDIQELRDKVLAGSEGPHYPMDKTYFESLRADIPNRTA